MLDHHAAAQDWPRALATLEVNLAQRSVDKQTARRQRAVLQTAIALDVAEQDAGEALRLSREAAEVAPDLTPAAALAARLLGKRGDLRKASRLIEASWKAQPHPELAQAYLDLRPGDSTQDRLARARTLARLAPQDPESALCLARAALEAHDFTLARFTMQPLIEGGARPTARMCLLMADLEELDGGADGKVREWLARASRAPRDKAWVADGVACDVWSPVSPVTGKLDALRWQAPAERLSAPTEPAPAEPAPALAPAGPQAVIETSLDVPVEPLAEAVGDEPANLVEPSLSSAPAQESLPQDDALNRLAAIRRAAKAEPPRRAELLPLIVAPDDPGPDAPRN